jgi:FtsP/CotA-like multicopper oxidase with cupredoxin domain
MLAWGMSETYAKPKDADSARSKKITHTQREAAAARAKEKGLALPVFGTAQMASPGTAPHYFGPYPNYANSPLRLADAAVTLTGDGTGATAAATVDLATGAITAIAVTNPGSGYTVAPAVTITSTGTGSGADATATIDPVAGTVTAVTVIAGGTGYVTPGIRKFVDTLPLLTPDGANNLGQYIPVAIPDATTYPGSDYFEIAVVQYREKMHSDLPPTLLRGYVQLETPANAAVSNHVALVNANLDGTTTPILIDGLQAFAADAPHYLGPLVLAQKNRPVRVLFRNLLPTGVAGDLFLPVDVTVMGSGMGPDMGGMGDPDPQNPMCGMSPKPPGCFGENRATLHLHGGISPWISDGTPHQWITPAGDGTSYPAGVSVTNVPDMTDPGPGAQTFFYTNQQSARLMFYHDHSWGITRLNVYAGEAAPYMITDPMEQSLVSQGIVPADQIPLVIQDKTFVPGAAELAMQDPTWDLGRWGGEGNLWLPHVYVPAQNPGDSSGVNQFGRWAYGPWFWPPTTQIAHGPIANPYYDPLCDSQVQWCEPPLAPGVPFLSMGMESFHDTPLVNGTAYPTITVEPKPYRMRILNAANDRFWNLQLYEADATGTEVALNPAEVAAALGDPTVFPTPVAPPGPSWIQIGTEGGFLPAPVVVPPQPITWVNDPTVFNAGNVDQHSLLLGPAERADVIVDFSAHPGKTFILYNDAPAAFPARDPRYDYYTGNANLTDTGGAPPTIAGFGPNTRTVMQIRVAAAPVAPAFDLPALETAFRPLSQGGQGVFETSQNPIIVGQGAYNSAYGSSFRTAAPRDGFVRITDFSFSFNTLLGQGADQTMIMPLQPKAIQDEMGESFEKEYGRMSGNLGLEAPSAQAGAQNLILYPYVNPVSEIIDGIELPIGVLDATPIATASDGTQIWKITHNGVDTHPIHFHLYDVQLVNRVGWDGIIRPPDANELGWKDTVRISPLEDTIVAVRAIIPKQPFGLPDSVRPLNPMMPLGSTAMFNNMDANGDPIVPAITNEVVNFGAEYVWHCHILSHEEMDMMRPVSVLLDRQLAEPPVVTYTRNGGVSLTWTDATPVSYLDLATWGSPGAEVGFRIERADVARNGRAGAYAVVGTALANATSFSDTVSGAITPFSYRVTAFNAAGDSVSMPVLVGPAGVAPPAAPTNLTAALEAGPRISLTWTDNATDETGFVVARATDGGTFVPIATPPERNNTGVVTYVDTGVAPGHSYQYRVTAVNGGGSSAETTSGLAGVPAVPPAPSNLTGSAAATNNKASVALSWTDNSLDETGFTLQRATDAAFTAGLSTSTLAANAVAETQTGLSRGTTYHYRIAAFNLGGASAWSNVFSVTTP